MSLLLVGTACSNPSDERAKDTVLPASETTIELSGVSIDASTIEELDLVRFSGIDLESDLSQLVLQGVVEGLDPMNMVLFVDDVGLYSIFPLHPEDPGSGGEIVLRLGIAGGQQHDFDVEVSGLPDAPGGWDRTVDAIVDDLHVRAEQHGMSLNEIAGTPISDLGGDVAVLKVVAGYMDDGSPNDLESLLMNPKVGLSDGQVDLVDRIMAKLGAEQFLSPPLGLESFEALSAGAASAHVDAPQVNAARAILAQSSSCWPNPLKITSGDDLAKYVKKGLDAQAALNDPTFKLAGDASSLAASTAGVVLVIGTATGVGAVPAAGVAGALSAVSAIHTTTKLWHQVDAGSFPTTFVTLDVGVDTPIFNEDFTEPGKINDVVVTAASTGFNVTEELASLGATALSAGAGAVSGLGKPEKVPGVVEAGEKIAGTLQETAIGAAMKEAKSFLEFCSKRWDVKIKDDRFVEAFAVNDNIKIDLSAMTYEPVEVGADTLRFETKKKAFPGVFAIADVAVETLKLEITSVPFEVEVERAGDFVDVNAVLENADTLDRTWDAEWGRWADGGTPRTTHGLPNRLLETPPDKNRFPFTVIVWSDSETGLREKATDRRSTKVKITLKQMVVVPDPGKVRTSGRLLFAAMDLDGNPREVTWTATGGDIDESGWYTAGKTPGTYSVTATATDDLSVIETVSVTIHDGECLIGTWVLRSQEFFDQVSAQAGGGAMGYRSGENRLVMRDDGTYSTIRSEWSFEVAVSVAGSQGTFVGVIDAENSGTWQSTDTEILVVEIGGDPVTVGLFLEVGGQLKPVSPVGLPPQTIASMGFDGQAQYTCDGDLMTSTADGVTSTFDRVDG